MPGRRILLLGSGDLTDETHAALEAAGAESTHLEGPSAAELSEALERGADAVAECSDLRIVLRAGSDAVGGETSSLERLGEVRDVHRIGAVPGCRLGTQHQRGK